MSNEDLLTCACLKQPVSSIRIRYSRKTSIVTFYKHTMSLETSLSKRIKRHIIGRRRTYFAVTSPGFEDLCFKELSGLALPIEDLSTVTGGVEFKGRLQDCFQANLQLRTANRILMRIDQFRTSSFRQLEKKTAGIPWELYLPIKSIPGIHVTTSHCRLYHTDGIGERFLAGISKHWEDTGSCGDDKRGAASEQTVFVRGVDDWFTVSIDSSGDHLHKRGLKRHHGKAPLRETLAAASLLMTGYNGTGPLIDPMCGTGTFSLEAALMVKNIPPGWYRDFAFMGWPSFHRHRWDFLKIQYEKLFTCSEKPLIFASDEDASACMRLEKCIAQHNLSEVIRVSGNNFFEIMPRNLTDQTGWITINPPYGRRLGSAEKSEQLFMRICDRLTRYYRGWRLVLIAPNRQIEKKIPLKLDRFPFFHGGLKPILMLGTIT
jgi:putative N6-adenine-specific DNA methylase